MTTRRTLRPGVMFTTDAAKAWTVGEWQRRSVTAGTALGDPPPDATPEDVLELKRQLMRREHERRKASRR